MARTTVTLPDDVLEELRTLAREQGITLSAALQKAIATEGYIRGQIESGGKVIIEKPDKTFTEVIFR